MKKIILLTGLALGLSILTGCGEKVKPGEQDVKRPVVKGVTIAEVMPVTVTDYYETAGTMKSRNTSMISAKVMGEVKAIRVGVGQRVRKGDTLLEISSPDINAKVKAAKEAVEEARMTVSMAEENKKLIKTTFDRYKRLYEGKAITEQEFDEIKTKKRLSTLRYEQALKGLGRARAMLKEAASFLGYTVIRSPLDGIVAEKKIDIGSMTAPGMLLFIIEEPRYTVEAPVIETLLDKIKNGTVADITIESINLKTRGRVSEIVHQIDPGTRTFTVKIDPQVTEKSFRGGLYCRVKFPIGKKARLLIPEESIVKKGQLRGVYVVDDKGVMTLRFVRTGKVTDGRVEILSGLKEGEMIVVSGIEKAVDGGRIGLNI